MLDVCNEKHMTTGEIEKEANKKKKKTRTHKSRMNALATFLSFGVLISGKW